MVEGTSDQAPVPSLYRTYSELCRDFTATLAAWRSLQPKIGGLKAGLKPADHSSRQFLGMRSCNARVTTLE
jgi:hypothetical protein